MCNGVGANLVGYLGSSLLPCLCAFRNDNSASSSISFDVVYLSRVAFPGQEVEQCALHLSFRDH